MKYFIIFTHLLLLPFFINAQITFTKIIRETPDENCGNMIVPLPKDDAYMIGSSHDALWDGFGLYKLSPEGDTLWRKYYPTNINYVSYCFGHGIPTQDGYAYIFSDDIGINSQGMLMTFDKEGNMIFNKTYGPDNSYDAFIRGSQNKDGSFILGGFARNLLTDTTSVFIQKTDAEGNAEWDAYFKDEEYRVQRARTVFEDHDGGFIIGGWGVNHLNFGEQAGLVIKLDKDGNEEWRKKLNVHDKAACDVYIRPMKKEEAYLVWACEVGNTTARKAYHYIAKWDKNYEEVWRTSFEPIFSIVDVKEMEDGRFIAVGYRRAIEHVKGVPFSGWLALLEYDGTIVWHKDYRYYPDVDDPKSRMESRLDDVMPALDGGFIATGLQIEINDTVFPFYIYHHLWVLKVDENGCIAGYPCEGDSIYLGDGPTIPVNEVWTEEGFAFRVYPNPVKGESLQISYRLPPSVKAARIELYTVTGTLGQNAIFGCCRRK